MAIGLDGYIEERVETLYVSEQYKIFLLTGQTSGTSSRRAYIDAKPFNQLEPDVVESMKSQAKTWSPDESRIAIKVNSQALAMRDGCTGTVSSIAIDRLDDDVRRALRSTPAARNAWDKYTAASPAAVKKPGRSFSL